MVINDDLRALTFDPPNMISEPRVVLALTRGRGGVPLVMGVTDLGDDNDALLEDDGARLFDLGLGRREARFGVRVSDGPAYTALRGAHGLPLAHAFPQCAGSLLAESPTRVVDSPLGRIEVKSRIGAAAGAAAPGPHTHLLPDQLATGRSLPVGMDLPRAYLPGAVFYPNP